MSGKRGRDFKAGADTRRKAKYDAATIAEARLLRSTGMSFDEIHDQLGPSLGTLHKWLADVQVPKAKKPKTANLSEFDRKERRQQAADIAASTPRPAVEPPTGGGEYFPTSMPTDPTEYDTSGLFPDPALLNHAVQLLKGWERDRAKGVVHERRPPAVSQALLVMLHDNRIWDYQAFLRDRDNWQVVRDLAGVNATEFGERVGIGASSVGRYEKNQRQPATGLLHTLHAAYSALLEEAISKTELSLAYNSAFDHYAQEHGVPVNEVEVDGELLLRYISGVGENLEHLDEVATIDHLDYLLAVRQMLPVPDWRDESVVPFDFVGYADSTELVSSVSNSGTE